MQNENTLTPDQLNAIIRTLPLNDMVETPFPPPKKWTRVDCGEIEVYVADRLFVVALLERQHKDVATLTSAHLSSEDAIVKYLRSEGFIDAEYAYIGMQKFEVDDLIDGLDGMGDLGGLE